MKGSLERRIANACRLLERRIMMLLARRVRLGELGRIWATKVLGPGDKGLVIMEVILVGGSS